MIEMIHADAQKPGRKEGDIDPRITVGATVRRKRGKQNAGVVKRIFTHDMTRCREWGWCPTTPHKVAVVHWSKAVRWMGGKSDWTSKVRLDALVLVEQRPATADDQTAA